jgi:hypothetical protein
LIGNEAPPVLPYRNDERHDAAGDQRQPQILGCSWQNGAPSSRYLLQMAYWTIAKPKPISAVAVRSHDIMVRSGLSRVRIQPK